MVSRNARRPNQPERPRYDQIVRQLAAYNREVSAEELAVSAGLKAEPAFEAINARYAALFAPRHLKSARDLAENLPGRALRENFARLSFALIEGRLERKLAKLDDAIASVEGQGKIACDGRSLAYNDVIPELGRLTDPAARERLWSAWLAWVEKRLNPLLVQRNRELLKNLKRLGYGSERALAQARTGVDYDELERRLHALASETDETYLFHMRSAVRKRFGLRFPGLSRVHQLALNSMREFDALFPADKLAATCAASFRGLGLDLEAAPNLRVDAEYRPNKDWRAFCVAIDPPEEVHLVIKPVGGIEDLAAYLHEAGHAWHYACTNARLPYESRCLPRSLALTETFAALFEYLPQDEGWLVKVAGLDPGSAAAVSRQSRLCDLALLRRFIGKLTYELEMNRHPADDIRNRLCFRSIMAAYTGLAYDGGAYLVDVDAGLYSADYLRAWLAEAQLRGHLVRTYGPEWFASKAAGDFLRSLYAKGDSWDAEDLVRSLGLEPWDPAPLLQRFADL